MVLKPDIKTAHRLAFREGDLSDIPLDVLAKLRSRYPLEEGQGNKPAEKPKAAPKQEKGE